MSKCEMKDLVGLAEITDEMIGIIEYRGKKKDYNMTRKH